MSFLDFGRLSQPRSHSHKCSYHQVTATPGKKGPVKQKPGVCPIDICDCAGPLPNECSTDYGCEKKKKCCYKCCAMRCVDPEKPGFCPFIREKCRMLNPPNYCDYDFECVGNLKCCEGICGRECLPPVYEKPGTCPIVHASCLLSREKNQCRNDEKCPGDKKCCQGACVKQCLTPEKGNPETCPTVNTTCQGLVQDQCAIEEQCTNVKPGVCPGVSQLCSDVNFKNKCENDEECPRQKKCCVDVCGKACISPAQDKGMIKPNNYDSESCAFGKFTTSFMQMISSNCQDPVGASWTSEFLL
ncbi:PREDICTED: WAP four-disulfide core domain protein 8-like [Thamnophis sirtalis]|uniref:WAP four-disulfide core domain protein 8-like n=1 Tax=Thamnophis sirtalis TaxID=35019 RepID=A0A6I9XZ79_9SAUR|nr:PREDICTED: WAP four-disulfide core domain protein 8-like [Thamnophis sirtalis]